MNGWGDLFPLFSLLYTHESIQMEQKKVRVTIDDGERGEWNVSDVHAFRSTFAQL